MVTKTLFPEVRPTLDLNFTRSKSVDPRITFTRVSTATRVNKFGRIEIVPSNVPRIGYDPTTLECKGLLIEESRTNLLTYSEQFDNSAWIKRGSVSVVANATVSPDGAVTADLISGIISGAGGDIYRYLVTTASSALSATIYIKKVTKSGTLLLANARNRTNGQYSINLGLVGDGWQRITATHPAVTVVVPFASDLNGYTGFHIRTENPVPLSFYIWGAQLEQGAFPTSYIPTTNAAATRAADVATMTGANFSSWYSQSEGTVFWEGSSLSPLTPSESVAAGKYPGAWVITGGTSQSNLNWYGAGADLSICGTYANQGTTTPFIVHRHALGVAPVGGQSASAIDGGIAVNKPGNTFGTNHNQLKLGVNLNGHLRRIAFYPKRLSNTELQSLTA